MADVDELFQIVRSLRAPATGCAWDRQQTFRSLVPYTLEEAYEVADTIESGALDELPDELGDLLFQIVFYCCIAEAETRFRFADVVTAICKKLRRRHPHIFNEHGTGAGQVVSWRQVKAQERLSKLGSAGELAGVGNALPALCRAQKLQDRAADVGFDWDDVGAVFAAVSSELDELREVLQRETDSKARAEEELGDLLFSCVNLARHLEIDAERALRHANRKFETRFAWMESALAASGRSIVGLTMAEFDALWVAAKAAERSDSPASQ